MERSEKAGLGIAVVAHALLLAVLSLGLLPPKPPLPKPVSDPIDIQFADEVGLVSGAPEPSTEAPATSEAPELGKPEEAAAAEADPTPAPPPPRPAPPPPAPEPEPKPVPVKKPVPPAPTPKPVPKPVPKPAPAPKPTPRPVPKPVPKPVTRPTPAPAPAKPAPAKPAAAKPAKPTPAPAAPTRTSSNSKATPAKPAPGKATPGKAATSTASSGAGTGKKTAGASLGDDFLKGITAEKSESRTQAPRAATVSATQMAGLVGAIQRQLLPCADRRSSPGPGSNRIVTRMRLQFRKDGSLAGPPTVLGQTGTDDENSRYATRVGELAVGIARECSPLKLPAELYEVGNGQGWNDIVIRYKLPG